MHLEVRGCVFRGLGDLGNWIEDNLCKGESWIAFFKNWLIRLSYFQTQFHFVLATANVLQLKSATLLFQQFPPLNQELLLENQAPLNPAAGIMIQGFKSCESQNLLDF